MTAVQRAVYSAVSEPAQDICSWCHDALDNGYTVVGHGEPPIHQHHVTCLLNQLTFSSGTMDKCSLCQGVIDQNSLRNIPLSRTEWKERQIQKLDACRLSFQAGVATEIFLTTLMLVCIRVLRDQKWSSDDHELQAKLALVACCFNAWFTGIAAAATNTNKAIEVGAYPIALASLFLAAMNRYSGSYSVPVHFGLVLFAQVFFATIGSEFADSMKGSLSSKSIAMLSLMESLNLLSHETNDIPWHIGRMLFSGLLAAGINLYSNSR